MTLASESPSISSALGLRVVSASAGSGKTHYLTEQITNALDPNEATPLAIDALLGVTYTVKAHAELEARIRRMLIENGAFERAEELPLAFVGTVHAVCLRLLEQFALDAGLAPTLDVIPGDEERGLLQAALERAFDPEKQARTHELASHFELEWMAQLSRNDWLTPVSDLMTLARSNRIPPGALKAMAERSIAGLVALLPQPVASGEPLERALQAALTTAIHQIGALDDGVKATREALALLRQSRIPIENGELSWATWARLALLEAGKRANPLLAPVREAARAYDRHPRFHAELPELTGLLYEAAGVGLDAYAAWKAERGLIDYVDMIDRALDLIDLPEIAAELRSRLDLIAVDEFQDTSPIQLALFMRLHSLTRSSVWVGDKKQCIFEYAGADPELMEAVTRWAREHGGNTNERLQHNYRSRPELVNACSNLFAAALAQYGHSADEVTTTAKRQRLPELDDLPPFGVFRLNGRTNKQAQGALARGIAQLLEHPERTPVLDRTTRRVRGVRPSDIAVLFYTNAEAKSLAEALAAQDIPSALPRTGLLTTPEGTLVTAALRLLVDRRDTLAQAELEMLTGLASDHEAWLSEKIRAHAHESSQPDQSLSEASLGVGETVTTSLDRLRCELSALSPTETLDRVLAVLDVPSLAVRWPDPGQRLANIDALRALARAYEARCAYQCEAASLGGLLRYFEETQQELRRRDEMRASDEQHVSGDEDAIVISTYHKAKGLEWPVVILGSLDRKPNSTAFDIALESDATELDVRDPLRGRWIRYWPWPLGSAGTTDSPLALRAQASPEGRAVAQRERHERLRLLYVGCTRARDHLIFAVREKNNSTVWLDELCDTRGPLITLPAANGDPIAMRGLEPMSVPSRTWHLTANDADAEPNAKATSPRYWFTTMNPAPSGPLAVPAYRIAPSRASEEPLDLPTARVLSSVRFTRRMPFITPKGINFDQIGTALHAFLAADREELTSNQRSETARRTLDNAGLRGAFEPDVLIAQSDALRSFIAERWPNALWHREIPISALLPTPHGDRRIHGTIDLLLETPHGYVIIDHKSFPGRASEWDERALGYAPQLLTYAKAIRMAGGTVSGMFIHFTIGGGIVEVAA